MSEDHDFDDDVRLFEALRDAFDEAPPDRVTRAAIDAFELTTLDLDIELAQLLETTSLAVRGPGDEVFLQFAFTGGQVALQVSPARVIGQIEPEGSYEITVTAPDPAATRRLTSDDIGRFQVDTAPPDRIVIRRTGTGTGATTDAGTGTRVALDIARHLAGRLDPPDLG